MSPGVSIRTSVSAGPHRAEILHGSEPRCDDMVRYTEWASEGLAHHFAVESDELRLKTNVRGGALSAHSRPSPFVPTKGPLTERTAGVQPERREKGFCVAPALVSIQHALRQLARA